MSENTNALEGKRCPKCGNEDELVVGARIWAVVRDDGIEDYRDPDWEGDAPASCPQCGFSGVWSDFDVLDVDEDTYSRCTRCGSTIWWDRRSGTWVAQGTSGRAYDPILRAKSDCPMGDKMIGQRHVPMWLTLGEFRHLTKDLPDSAPITAAGTAGMPEWVNVHLTKEAVDLFVDHSQPSVILDLEDDLDTRQW